MSRNTRQETIHRYSIRNGIAGYYSRLRGGSIGLLAVSFSVRHFEYALGPGYDMHVPFCEEEVVAKLLWDVDIGKGAEVVDHGVEKREVDLLQVTHEVG